MKARRTLKLADVAPAKVNLTLAVLGRRRDGYHSLDSVVVFAEAADRLTFVPGRALSLKVRGAGAESAGPVDDNLVLKAARALAEHVPGLRLGAFTLDKRLPVAAGLGGGSSDAAAALRLLARANRMATTDPRLFKVAKGVGADVPVCIDPKPRRMRGIGEKLSAPLDLPKLHAVLVNPGVAVPTRDVFALIGLKPGEMRRRAGRARPLPHTVAGAVRALAEGSNDLEPAAIKLQPVIARVLAALRREPGCLLARMSGSGATCFGLFQSSRHAAAAAKRIKSVHAKWWVQAGALG
jgi:4-diphosphocytidyl-2-C-methyl-D-erythritol kinase